MLSNLLTHCSNLNFHPTNQAALLYLAKPPCPPVPMFFCLYFSASSHLLNILHVPHTNALLLYVVLQSPKDCLSLGPLVH